MAHNPMPHITRLSVTAFAAMTLMVGSFPAAAAHPPQPGTVAASEDSGPGEAEAIRQRYRLELEMRGITADGAGARRLLRRTRKAYGEYLRGDPGLRTMGIGDADWISLGPNNGAGRFTAVAPHPSVPGTILAGAAGGGVWVKKENVLIT